MANFKVGDEVVCVDAKGHSGSFCTSLVAGNKYRVLTMRRAPCCGVSEIDVGGESPTGFSRCICGARNSGAWSLAWRFIKLDGLKEDQTVENEVTA